MSLEYGSTPEMVRLPVTREPAEVTTKTDVALEVLQIFAWKHPDAMTMSGTVLADGITISFSEATYTSGDSWTFVAKPRSVFTGNLSWPFITGAGTIEEIPTTAATSVVGDAVVTSGITTTTSSTFEVESTDPEDEASYVTIPDGEYTIEVVFSDSINPATVVSGVDVTVTTEAVNGDTSISAYASCIARPSVSGDTLSIVVASGYLLNNNLVTVTLDSTIASAGGVSLGEDYTFWFTTTYSPYYCTLRKIQLEIGAYASDVADDTINLAIFEASLAADAMTWATDIASGVSDYYSYVRTQWSCCKAQEILLINILRGGDKLKSKQLGDLRVEYYQAPSNALDRALDCLNRLEGALKAGGAEVQAPSMVIKEEWDADRPNVGRGWFESTNDGVPAGNTLYRDTASSTRYRTMYSSYYRGRGRYQRK